MDAEKKPSLMTKAVFSFFVMISFQIAYSNCVDSESRFLPNKIGIPEGALPVTYYMPCDTMEVREGDTSRIYSSVYLHFGENSNERKIILVKGTLIIQGSPSNLAFFAGSLLEHTFGYKAGPEIWGGIRVAEKGVLRISNAKFVNASFPVDTKSWDISIRNSEFKGCLYLVKPDKSSTKLDYTGTTIKSMDFNQAGTPVEWSVVSPTEKKSKTPKGTTKKSLAPWLWGGAGLVTIGVGATAWILSQDNTSNPPMIPPDASYPALPQPPNPEPRKP